MDSNGDTALEFLERQHEDIRALLSDVEKAPSDDAFQMLVRLLAVHETAEEMVVYPALKANVPDGVTLADARIAEEDEAKKVLADLESMGVEDPQFRAAFRDFAKSVRAHAGAEERTVFPVMREHLADGLLQTMKAGLVAAQAVAPTHPHRGAPESAIGNMMVGPFVAIADRVRDAIRDATR